MWIIVLILVFEGAEGALPLPAAPPELARLIERGEVRFAFYGDDEAERRYPALTKFDFEYSFRARHSYRETRSADGRVLLIRPRIAAVTFSGNHTIELPERLRGPDFYDDPLVRHEFDHVRISSDPRWKSLFRKRASELKVLRVPLDAGEQVTEQLVDEAVRGALRDVFDDVRELISIRYRELDRLTAHGQKPLAEDYWKQYADGIAPSTPKERRQDEESPSSRRSPNASTNQ